MKCNCRLKCHVDGSIDRNLILTTMFSVYFVRLELARHVAALCVWLQFTAPPLGVTKSYLLSPLGKTSLCLSHHGPSLYWLFFVPLV